MDWFCAKTNKAIKRPPVGSLCHLEDDGSKRLVKIVAHSEFDESALFVDSKNWKGVVNLNDGWIKILPFNDPSLGENVISIKHKLPQKNKKFSLKKFLSSLLNFKRD